MTSPILDRHFRQWARNVENCDLEHRFYAVQPCLRGKVADQAIRIVQRMAPISPTLLSRSDRVLFLLLLAAGARA